MSEHKQPKHNDQLDIFLSQSLKKWADNRSPQPFQKAVLLRSISSTNYQPDSWFNRIVTLLHQLFMPKTRFIPVNEFSHAESPTLSQLWFAHIASSWRLSH
jgi:hypothetical protein